MQYQESLLIVAAGIIARINHEESEQAAVEAAAQIVPGPHMRVIPARATGARSECVTRLTTGRNVRCALFHRAVDLRRKKEPVPVHHLFV